MDHIYLFMTLPCIELFIFGRYWYILMILSFQESLGARSIDDVVKLFEMQADTSRQLSMVWKDTEANIKQLKKKKQDNELEIEKLKYADNLEEIR